jgi:amphiphysin
MSWKGLKKAVVRLPANISKATGGLIETKDEEFEQYLTQFGLLEKVTLLTQLVTKLSADAIRFKDSLSQLLSHQTAMADCFLQVFPDNSDQKLTVDAFSVAMNNARENLSLELEQIERIVIAPIADYISMLDNVKKYILKRSHKQLDYDRHRTNLEKLRVKPNRTVGDEKTLGQYEQNVDIAARDYNNYNNMLKQELPILLNLRIEFVDPCLLAFYNYQVKVYHTLYSICKSTLYIVYEPVKDHFDLSSSAQASYDMKANEVMRLLTSLTIPKRFGNAAEKPRSFSPTPFASKAATAHPAADMGVRASNKVVYATALYDFNAEAAGDLSFKKGDKIEVVEKKDDANEWWFGKLNGKTGQFPGK